MSNLVVLGDQWEPLYEETDGWKEEDMKNAKTFEELPTKGRKYVERIEELTGTRVSIVSIGPKRSETIIREEVL